MIKKIVIDLEVEGPKVVSNNDMYMHPVKKTKSGRYVSYFCKSGSLKSLQEFYSKVFNDQIMEEDIESLKKELENPDNGISITFLFGMPASEVYQHDVSNFIKAIEDCVVERTKIDDSRHISVTAAKSIYENKDWVLSIVIGIIPLLRYEELRDEIRLN